MAYQVLQKRRFLRPYKKLHANVVGDVDDAIADIAEQPSIGERKKGDLAKLYVYKFMCQNQQYLLGYTTEDEICLIYLEAILSHENFYRDLKRK